MTDPAALSATELIRLYGARALSPVEVAQAVLARIDRFNAQVNAFAFLDAEDVLEQAQDSEARWMRGEPRGLLDGVPATVKDNILARGWPTRKGSLTTDDAPAPDDGPSVASLRAHGAVLLGKTTMPEFGWKGLGDSPLTGVTRNPWAFNCTTGGSSAGAAAAAALNLGALHIGTDGAGSIRIPCGFTGVFGLKPSMGRVPAHPVSVFAALAHIGPMTRNVTDAALMLTVMSQPDPRDSTAWNTPPPDYRLGLDEGIRGLRVAVSLKLGGLTRNHPDVERRVIEAAHVFADLGAHVEDADPGIGDPIETLLVIWRAGAAFVLEDIPEARHGSMDLGLVAIGREGQRVSAVDYLRAMNTRAELAIRMTSFHAHYDLLLTPSLPIPAFEAGRDTPASGEWGEHWIAWTPYTYPFNLSWQPAASCPCGLTGEGLPIGLQIVGPPRRDDLVLRAARAFERARPFPIIEAPREGGSGRA